MAVYLSYLMYLTAIESELEIGVTDIILCQSPCKRQFIKHTVIWYYFSCSLQTVLLIYDFFTLITKLHSHLGISEFFFFIQQSQ